MICGMHLQKNISPFYKAWVVQGDITVCGFVSRESRIVLAQLWNSPFEGDSAGNGSKVAALGQDQSGLTSVTKWNSKIIWDGAQALEFPLILQFLARSNAKLEVDDPVKHLMRFSSPELNDMTPFGQRPLPVSLDIGRKIKISATSSGGAFIKNVEFDYNAVKTKDGYFLHNEVTLTCSTDGSINRSEISNIFL